MPSKTLSQFFSFVFCALFIIPQNTELIIEEEKIFFMYPRIYHVRIVKNIV